MPSSITKKTPAKAVAKSAVPSKSPGRLSENSSKRSPKAQQAAARGNSPFEDNFDTSLKDLFISELKDIYWSEQHLVAAIPKMIEAAKGSDLKRALKDHLQETINQAKRLESVFQQAGIPVIAKKCAAMEGLTIGGENVIESTLAGSMGRETGIISSGIKVEQFETTCYTGLIEMANQLGMKDAAEIFQQNLNEEVAASNKLNGLKSKDQSQ